MFTTIRPHDIATLLDAAPAGIEILSLDCFDTLLWRATHLPQDVFATLGHGNEAGGAIEPRADAERKARRLQARVDGRHEVAIEQIHAQLNGAEGVAAELAAEARHCYAFAPTVALIRAAKARGLTVVIVSDTYLSEPQLRGLIAASAGEDVAAMIDRIFCSSEHGVSKGDGLFAPVIRALGATPGKVLHVGDNRIADGVAAEAAGIRAVYIQQFDDATTKRLRLEAAAAVMVDPATRVTRPALQPHRAAIALTPEGDAAWRLGHDVFGPVFDAFARWVDAEANACAAANGRPVKRLYLLRDGFLPHHIAQALGQDGAAIAISRFTARRASFTDEAAIRDYLEEEETARIPVLANQLALTANEAAKLGATAAEFRRNVLGPDTVKRIVSRSAAFARRLAAHVVREARVEQGDTLMLIDLGYHGTVQRLVAPVLEAALGVAVEGRYLLMRDTVSATKRGLIDARHYSRRTLTALARQVAIVEQVATSGSGSVIDYADNGRAILKPCKVPKDQAATRAAIQAGAIAFAETAPAAVHRAPACDDTDTRRAMAVAVLARLLFLPQQEEIAVFGAFEHDVNLGTDDLVGLVDHDHAAVGLRRRGMPYLCSVDRMFLPGELQPHGLPLNLALFAANTFELDLRATDFHVAATPVGVLLADAREQMSARFDAHPTHDGFQALTIPIGAARYGAGVQLGQLAEVVQIDEIAFYRVAELSASGGRAPRPIAAAPIHDAMERIAEDLWRCTETSLLFVPPPAVAGDEPLALSIVFRPVVTRGRPALRAVA